MEIKEESFNRVMESVVIKIKDNRQNYDLLFRQDNAWPRLPVIKSVPNMLREENGKAYTPSVVSIGPLHNRNEFLKTMEADKEVVDDDTSSSRLVEMMLIDGCFIIELIYRHYKKEKEPILQDAFRHSAILRDLLLLENQIPFIALEELFRLTVESMEPVSGSSSANLIECILSFFGDRMGLEDTVDFKKKDRTRDPYHILHLLHICHQPVVEDDDDAPRHFNEPQGGRGGGVPGRAPHQEQPSTRHEATQPVDQNIAGGGGVSGACPWHLKKPGTGTQLYFEGVKLRKHKTKNLFDVRFRGRDSLWCFWRGRLEIPRFCVYNFTDSLLRNLIAFEQCCPWIKSSFTSHAFLMDILIDSVDDVKLLEKKEVLCNHLGSRESVAQIFNGIIKNITDPRPFHYLELRNEMKRFRTAFREQLATVTRHLGGNLWIVISVIGALFIFMFALLQTIYSIRASK
ncbi:UPF0481 protein At3g47200-like [Cornus florida]|uniref:UPF0481 protein At3g47200-like n=1 Tax=Cornus florida TaxID=4283 RepID=UPI00289FC146|nr:UPF0481 protein At3g47200-like [Cornus florida]